MIQNNSSSVLKVTPLGGGQEVGRSCLLLEYRGRTETTVMLDCGTHPGMDGDASLPFFDSIPDIARLDLLLVTHFHIDHCAALPHFTEKTPFRGRILMTHATKAVMKLLLGDNIRLQHKSKFLYTESDLQACVDKIDVIDFHQTIVHKGVHVTASPAGHVLGAAMFTLEIDGVRVLYTGDYSMEQDRHLIPGSLPNPDDITSSYREPDLLIVESTFGVTTLPGREERETKFTQTIHSVAARGGRCLIPVFALGRAQELLLVLDEYWQAHPELQHVPVYYVSRLASKALRVYQTFVNTMSDNVRDGGDSGNPFRLSCVQSVTAGDGLSAAVANGGPCVVMAAPGFLQSGASRELFELWCEDDRSAVVIAGYTVEGTLAHDLLGMPREITCMDGRIKQRRCQVEHISFSAHVDFKQNMEFIKAVRPHNIMLVHGEATGMKRLKEEIERDLKRNPREDGHMPKVAMPENGVPVSLTFDRPIIAEIVGSAATQLLQTITQNKATSSNSNSSSGANNKFLDLPERTLLITEEFSSRVLLPNDISHYTPCRSGRVSQRAVIPLPIGYGLAELSLKDIQVMLEEVFDDVELVFDPNDADYSNESGSNNSSKNNKSNKNVVEDVENANDRPSAYLKVEQLCEVRPVGRGVASDKAGLTVAGNTPALVVLWAAGHMPDMIAECVIGLLSRSLSAPALLRASLGMARPAPAQNNAKKIKH